MCRGKSAVSASKRKRLPENSADAVSGSLFVLAVSRQCLNRLHGMGGAGWAWLHGAGWWAT
ncbi:hypothetical protein EIKCOROL_00061 [Eikenella corrodens ATCC 23834]|uniref:Uncharacterized protein n=1 Tax=Eikenella corrodens ATCC 23834 TaxID=546274 RepID=C0DRU5_EIKCO|nr:hypothetical protein EIKCOROL_00061 [Eikenella corrodens ATCC 23834]